MDEKQENKYYELIDTMCEYCSKVLKKEEPTGIEAILFPEVLKALMKYRGTI